jgi:PIN domain nuclease of toxin-antitoxin system
VRQLLDIHLLLWAVDEPSQLGPQTGAELQDPANELLLSVGFLWELAIKVG